MKTDEIINRQKSRTFGKFRMTSLKSIIEWNKIKSGLKIRERKRRERTYEFKDRSTRSRRIDANPTCRGYSTADAGEKRILQLICNIIQMVRGTSEFGVRICTTLILCASTRRLSPAVQKMMYST